jgi:hypothetical protein
MLIAPSSHMGVDPAPGLYGDESTNSLKGKLVLNNGKIVNVDTWIAPIQPWLRSVDGINIHDLAFNNSIAGGITTALVLPGSAGNIGESTVLTTV